MADILKNTLVGELAIPAQLFVLSLNEKIESALETAMRTKVTAFPVWNEEKGQFIGMLDNFDVLDATVLPPDESDAGIALEFGTGTLADLMRLKYNPQLKADHVEPGILEFEASANIKSAMKALGQLHRCLVKTGNSTSIVSQSDILRFIIANLDKLTEGERKVLATPIEELGLANRAGGDVFKVSTKSSAMEAFRALRKARVSGIAVVDDQNRIVANLSVSNLRGVDVRKLDLAQGVVSFLRETSTVFHPVTCGPRATLSDVVFKLVAARVHRVWVVNSAEQPIGVVSISDVIRIIGQA